MSGGEGPPTGKGGWSTRVLRGTACSLPLTLPMAGTAVLGAAVCAGLRGSPAQWATGCACALVLGTCAALEMARSFVRDEDEQRAREVERQRTYQRHEEERVKEEKRLDASLEPLFQLARLMEARGWHGAAPFVRVSGRYWQPRRLAYRPLDARKAYCATALLDPAPDLAGASLRYAPRVTFELQESVGVRGGRPHVGVKKGGLRVRFPSQGVAGAERTLPIVEVATRVALWEALVEAIDRAAPPR